MPETRYRRFTPSDLLEHLVQMASFIALAVTGLVQKWPDNWFSEGIIDLLGGIESVRIIHRVWATVLMIAVVYHYGAIGYRRFVLRRPRAMIPGTADLKAMGQSVRYAVGSRETPPPQGRFTWEEKVEYWSLVWGTVIMIVTGFLLWNPIATTQFLPGDFIPAAQSAHGNEAFLAVLAVAIWHVYHVHFQHWNTSIWSGYMSAEEMATYHPLELESIEAGAVPRPLEGEEKRKAATRYLSVYSGVAVVLLVGIYFFISFENTAIETIEPIEDVIAFVPAETTTTMAPTTTTTPPDTTAPVGTTTTTPATGDATWATFADTFAATCTMCHGATDPLAGLSLTSYAGAVAGGVSGPGIVLGDADGSQIVTKMEAGGHPGQLSEADLAALREWITAGAPETGDGEPPDTTTTTSTTTSTSTTTTTVASDAAATWGTFEETFASTCAACHGATDPLAGLSLTSYAGAVAGGVSGPGIVPGDADGSQIVTKMEAGGHPGQLSDADLAALREWITAGAPETDDVPTTTTPASDATWGTFEETFASTCAACHGATDPLAGLSLTSYAGAVAGGVSGPGIVPGDADGSQIVTKMEAGGHPGQLSDADLAALREWITAGAPES